jgi:hypothetical protein
MPPHSSAPRRRGAQPGNLNAVSHGFYSTRFKKAERTAIENSDFTGLADEIALLRLYIRRVVAESLQFDDFAVHLEALRVISLASASLTSLIKLHVALTPSAGDKLHDTFMKALERYAIELEQKNHGSALTYMVPEELRWKEPSGEKRTEDNLSPS